MSVVNRKETPRDAIVSCSLLISFERTLVKLELCCNREIRCTSPVDCTPCLVFKFRGDR
jgi:hypothetical protein